MVKQAEEWFALSSPQLVSLWKLREREAHRGIREVPAREETFC